MGSQSDIGEICYSNSSTSSLLKNLSPSNIYYYYYCCYCYFEDVISVPLVQIIMFYSLPSVYSASASEIQGEGEEESKPSL